MNTRMAVLVLLALTVVGCTSSPGYGEISYASFAGPVLGVITDKDLQVIEIEPGSAAEKAGVQVGDILLDLTWIPSDAPAYSPESSDVAYTDTNPAPMIAGDGVTDATAAMVTDVLPVAVTPIPPPVESYIEKGTVPFTDGDRIRSLRSYGVPLRLRLKRGDQMLELTIMPMPRVPRPTVPNEPIATGTPVMPPYDYF